MSDYSAIAAVNWSSLKYMSVSPRMYRYRLTHPEPRKPTWVLGGAIHCMVLEPDVFPSRYAIFDAETLKALAPGRNTKAGKGNVDRHPEWATDAMTSDEYQAACVALAHPGKEPLTVSQHATCVIAAGAVGEHRVARDLLRGGLAEEAIEWTDPDTGLRCKGRLDYLRPDLVIDLKSSADPSPAAFERAAVNFGYAAQVAFYTDGALASKRMTGNAHPCIIAVRTKDDFDVACFQLSSEALEIGRAVYKSLLRRLSECISADYFPGVAPELKVLDLPPWAVKQAIEAPEET